MRGKSCHPARPRPYDSSSVVGYGGSLASSLRLRDGAHLSHCPQKVVAGPLLYQLAALLIKAVDVDPAYLDTLATTRNTEELPLVGATMV